MRIFFELLLTCLLFLFVYSITGATCTTNTSDHSSLTHNPDSLVYKITEAISPDSGYYINLLPLSWDIIEDNSVHVIVGPDDLLIANFPKSQPIVSSAMIEYQSTNDIIIESLTPFAQTLDYRFVGIEKEPEFEAFLVEQFMSPDFSNDISAQSVIYQNKNDEFLILLLAKVDQMDRRMYENQYQKQQKIDQQPYSYNNIQEIPTQWGYSAWAIQTKVPDYQSIKNTLIKTINTQQYFKTKLEAKNWISRQTDYSTIGKLKNDPVVTKFIQQENDHSQNKIMPLPSSWLILPNEVNKGFRITGPESLIIYSDSLRFEGNKKDGKPYYGINYLIENQYSKIAATRNFNYIDQVYEKDLVALLSHQYNYIEPWSRVNTSIVSAIFQDSLGNSLCYIITHSHKPHSGPDNYKISGWNYANFAHDSVQVRKPAKPVIDKKLQPTWWSASAVVLESSSENIYQVIDDYFFGLKWQGNALQDSVSIAYYMKDLATYNLIRNGEVPSTEYGDDTYIDPLNLYDPDTFEKR